MDLWLGNISWRTISNLPIFSNSNRFIFNSTFLGLKLFGEGYSGLEYDYKGLCNVYNNLNQQEKLQEFSQTLERWRIIREDNNEVSWTNKNGTILVFFDFRKSLILLCTDLRILYMFQLHCTLRVQNFE